MELLLMTLAISLLGVAVSAALFAAVTREEPHGDVPVRLPAPRPGAPRFFAKGATSTGPAVPIELLLEIQHHVRIERAVAEAFLAAPTRDSLHRPTRSPLGASRRAS